MIEIKRQNKGAIAIAGVIFLIAAIWALKPNKIETDISILLRWIPYASLGLEERSNFPAAVTNDFITSFDAPSGWSKKSGCPNGSLRNPSGGCWSLVVDKVNALHLIIPSLSSEDCQNALQADPGQGIGFLRAISVAPDGGASLDGAVYMSDLSPQERKDRLKELGFKCSSLGSNQVSFVYSTDGNVH